MMPKVKPLVLIIFDGWGHREEDKDNAINNANKPNFDHLWETCPHTLVDASGLMVGLPKGQMGNSEVGHVNLGSGRVVYQELTRIDKAIEEKTFFDNQELCQAVDEAVKENKAVHLMGLASPGGVHSHENHILAMIELAHKRGAKKVYFHAFLDGRDMPPKSAEPSLMKIDEKLKSLKVGQIISLCGRYYAMDRDNRWERTETAYNLVTDASANFEYSTSIEALKAAYERDETDEFVKPSVIACNGEKVTLNDGDALIYMNFRADRARSLSQPYAFDDFSQFKRNRIVKTHFVTLTEYAADLPVKVAYKPEKLVNTLGEYLAKNKMTQLRIAETEKYAHVTFFFNGGVEKPFDGEDRTLIQSPDVATYDLKPEMSAYELTDKLCDAISSDKYNVIICNYANSDMVGHTGKYDAAVKAIEALDVCLGRLIKSVKSAGGEMLITADHGNSDMMVDPITGVAHTAHTTNPVPLIYVGRDAEVINEHGVLSDIAPTMINLLGMEQPKEMTGKPIFKAKD
jgi:2,3-bisphosphoglycerate-independent phosphoglycerate mutase